MANSQPTTIRINPPLVSRWAAALAGMAVIAFVLLMVVIHQPHLAGLVSGLMFLSADLAFATVHVLRDMARRKYDWVALDVYISTILLSLCLWWFLYAAGISMGNAVLAGIVWAVVAFVVGWIVLALCFPHREDP